ncbi:OmpA family protein [Sesbania bispinosa]|nr:OmpA family protein [Sesbania bispinosa]
MEEALLVLVFVIERKEQNKKGGNAIYTRMAKTKCNSVRDVVWETLGLNR